MDIDSEITQPIFERLRDFTNEANQTNSILDKVKVIEKYSDLKNLFVYTYDTINYTYGIMSLNIKEKRDLGRLNNRSYSIIEVLNLLSDRLYTGHNAIKLINGLLEDNPEYEDLIYNIIDRNLKTRTDKKLINRVWPELIPDFNVALAETYKDKMKIDFLKDKYYASRKCDGVRLIAKVKEGNVELSSRQGKQFTTLSVLKEDILKVIPKDSPGIVFDGEICLVDENGDEDFQSVMEQIRKKDHTIENPMFMVFDILWLDDFEKEYCEMPFARRLEWLMGIIPNKMKHIKILPQILVEDNEDFIKMREDVVKTNWEGLILRKANSPYEGKRSKNLLKVKVFIDAEYIVKDIEIGPIRHFIEGKEVTSEMLSNIIIEHKGNQVGVGSGFSMEQRLHFKDHPEELLGKVVTVTYFEETKNQDGSYSLRFPTVKAIHGEERTT